MLPMTITGDDLANLIIVLTVCIVIIMFVAWVLRKI